MGGLEEMETSIPTKKNLKGLWYDFFKDFRDYLAEYIRESVIELYIGELSIKGQVKLFDGFTHAKIKIKNQGNIPCFISTTGQGGFRLDPGEKEEMFVNQQIIATTLSGSTSLGLIKT